VETKKLQTKDKKKVSDLSEPWRQLSNTHYLFIFILKKNTYFNTAKLCLTKRQSTTWYLA